MIDKITCPYCGKENPPEAEFCESCLTPLHDHNTNEAGPPEEGTPEWLQKIREKNQTEKPGTPPLGEFGEAEERPFGEGVVPGEIPDWLKEIQKTELPIPEEPAASEGDWMSRLHEILPESDRQTLQSTTFYSEEELKAMAAASRKLEPADFEPPEKANTQPLDAEPEINSSDFVINFPGEPEKPISAPSHVEPEIEPASLLNGPEFSEKSFPLEEPPEPEIKQPGREIKELADESFARPQDDIPAESKEEPILAEPVEPVQENLPLDVMPPAEPEKLIPKQVEPVPEPAAPENKKEPLPSNIAQEAAKETENTPDEKPEQLIPEGVLQPQYNRPVEYSGRLELSEAQRISIAQLKSMLVGEIQPPSPTGNRGKFSNRTFRLVIGILLLAAMIIPLVTGYTVTGQQALFSPGVVAMHKTIAALPENASFLVITDYEPAFSSELKAASIGVLDSLMMKRMNFSILSTIPSGPALAHDLIATVRSGAMAYPPEKISYLGFLPGGTTGLRDFIHGPRQAMPLLENGVYAWTNPASQNIYNIQDYAGILIITENTETGRAWIEQLHGSMQSKPLLLIVSAQSAPLMRPYLDSDQLSGLIGGRVEGAMYDRIMEFPPQSTTVMAAYQVGMLLAAVLILAGGLYGILKGIFNRRAPSSSEDWHVS